jgi:hypothetical protein
VDRRRVLLTGAAGTIGALLLPGLRERYDLIPLDIKPAGKDGVPIGGLVLADLNDPNRDAYREHFRGTDAVVHLGYVSTPEGADPDAHFRSEYSNIAMAYNVYRTAWEEGVRRVVVASSNHAADYWERQILGGQWDYVAPEDKALSDNYYGWAKECYEHLGFVFATGAELGRPLENVQIRIGGPRETDLSDTPPGDLVRMRRALAVYISQRDLVQLFVKSIETEDITDPFGVPFQIFYGISDNPHAFWSIVNARNVIGYEPEDNSELRFGALIAGHLAAYQRARNGSD